MITLWSEFTYSAIKISAEYSEPIQDNEKLPEILGGIERMFGEDTPAAFIVKGILLHMSVNVVEDWPQVAPLSNKEIKKYINSELLPLLRVMMLADNEGWVMFYPEDRLKQRNETLKVFENVELLISM